MDPKEYLKQVLAKAKAAKSLGAPSTEIKAGPSTPTAQPVMGTQPVTAPFLPITPLPSPVPASETFQSNELELLNAITQVDANSAEEEEQVLEAVESISSEAMIHDFEKTHPQYPAAIHDADLLPTLTK
jgi:hypothetical protein